MSITSANASLFLGVLGVFPIAQQIQQWAVDDAFGSEPIEPAEIRQGIDGTMTAGFIFVPQKFKITLMGDSPSNDMFDQWYLQQQVVKDILYATGALSAPTLGGKWALTRGVLSSYQSVPAFKKTVEPRSFEITFQTIIKSPI